MSAGHGGQDPRAHREATWLERTAVAATGAVSGSGRHAATVGGGAATASSGEGPKERVRRYNRAQAAHLILIGGCDPCAAGGTLLRQEELCQSDAVWVAGWCWPSPSAVIELLRRNDPDDRRPAPNRSRSGAPSPPVSTGWGGHRSIPAWWPGSVARVTLAKATDLLDVRYGLGEALGGMILLSVCPGATRRSAEERRRVPYQAKRPAHRRSVLVNYPSTGGRPRPAATPRPSRHRLTAAGCCLRRRLSVRKPLRGGLRHECPNRAGS
jgi:hypothetical protein